MIWKLPVADQSWTNPPALPMLHSLQSRNFYCLEWFLHTGGSKNGTFAIGNIGNAGGFVQDWSATGSFQITANESCNLSLISANGGLVNQSNTSANKISYNAVVYDSESSANLVPVPTAPASKFSAFNSKFTAATLGNETINFGVLSPRGAARLQPATIRTF